MILLQIQDKDKDSFKKRYSSHNSSFRYRKYKLSTTLSSYVWKLKDENVPYRVSWDIAGRAAPFNPASNICRLCLLEKYLIMFRPAGATLKISFSVTFIPEMYQSIYIINEINIYVIYFINDIFIYIIIKLSLANVELSNQRMQSYCFILLLQ